MFTIPNFYLTDSSGQVWQLGATGLEAYTTTPVSGPTGLPNFVLVDLVTGVFWSMTVLTTGTLEIDETALAGQENIPVISTSGALVGIVILAGAIAVIRIASPCITGVIYDPPSYLPPFTQPGGVGTATFPQQDIGSIATAQFVLGCGHGINNVEIRSDSCNGVQTAIVVCPLCNYAQRLLSPYDSIYTYPNEIIFP